MHAAWTYDALDRLGSIGCSIGAQTAPVNAQAYLGDAASCSLALRNDLESGFASGKPLIGACQGRTRATREDGTGLLY